MSRHFLLFEMDFSDASKIPSLRFRRIALNLVENALKCLELFVVFVDERILKVQFLPVGIGDCNAMPIAAIPEFVRICEFGFLRVPIFRFMDDRIPNCLRDFHVEIVDRI